MTYQEHKHQSPKNISCSVIIVSDSRTEQNDESGKYIMQVLKDNNHEVLSYSLLKNDADAIKKRVNELLNENGLEVIIISGGTGISHRDVTVETISPVLDKIMDGFGELFRFFTHQQIGTGSIMSRAIAGVARGKVIICLPGSLGAVNLAMEKIILPEIGHMVREAKR
ncbi:MAG: MogA/MoaB family molybdenum cofactor biosynthesis protein [Chloroflexota bacterium]